MRLLTTHGMIWKPLVWKILCAAFCAFAFVGCTGSQKVPDNILQEQAEPTHFHLLRGDADMVLSVRDLPGRLEKIQKTKTWGNLKTFLISKDFPGVSEAQDSFAMLEKITLHLNKSLQGRATLAIYPDELTPGNDKDNILLIFDGDAQEIIKLVEELAEADTPGKFTDLGNQIFRYDGDGEEFYLFQDGDMGFISSTQKLLQDQQKQKDLPNFQSLKDASSFQALTKELDPRADVTIWVNNWTNTDEDWGAMLGEATNDKPLGFAMTISLEGGLSAQSYMELDKERLMQDPDIAGILPLLSGTQHPPTIPNIVPEGAAGYASLTFNPDALLKQLQNKESPAFEDGAPPVIREMISNITGAISGEVAFVVLEADPKKDPSLLMGVPAPEMLLIAKLKDERAPDRLRPTVRQLFAIAQTQTDGLLQDGAPVDLNGVEIVVYPTTDEEISVAYAFHPKGYLLVGTEGAVRSILNQQSGQKMLAQGLGKEPASDLMSNPSNFAFHLDLLDAYTYAHHLFQFQLAVMSEGKLGGSDDFLLTQLFPIFRYVGGSVVMSEDRILLRSYITADETP